MSLEAKYNSAASGTNAGKAKLIGTANTPVVNAFDGVGRNPNNTAPDEFQTEFNPNQPGDFRYNAGGKISGTYTLSRWLAKAVNKVDTLFANPAFTTLIRGDVRNATNRMVHKFSPLSGKSFKESPSLKPIEKSRI